MPTGKDVSFTWSENATRALSFGNFGASTGAVEFNLTADAAARFVLNGSASATSGYFIARGTSGAELLAARGAFGISASIAISSSVYSVRRPGLQSGLRRNAATLAVADATAPPMERLRFH